MVMLTLQVVEIIEKETEEGKKKIEKKVMGPIGLKIVRNQFVLFAGPKVGEETMILAVRVLE